MGFKVQDTRRGPDGGIDLRLSKGTELATVQCKHWKTRKVPVQVIREQLGIVTAEGANVGIVVASGSFTKEARKFARGKPLKLIDGEQLQALLGHRGARPESPGAEFPLVDSPVAAVLDPSCRVCNGPMAFRTARRGRNGGTNFWGCQRYPKCRGTRDIQ